MPGGIEHYVSKRYIHYPNRNFKNEQYFQACILFLLRISILTEEPTEPENRLNRKCIFKGNYKMTVCIYMLMYVFNPTLALDLGTLYPLAFFGISSPEKGQEQQNYSLKFKLKNTVTTRKKSQNATGKKKSKPWSTERMLRYLPCLVPLTAEPRRVWLLTSLSLRWCFIYIHHVC